MPPRLTWKASRSVPVCRAEAWIVYGIDASAAVAASASNTAGCTFEPRSMTGPEPNGCAPISVGSTPGASVAWVTSTTRATSGRRL